MATNNSDCTCIRLIQIQDPKWLIVSDPNQTPIPPYLQSEKKKPTTLKCMVYDLQPIGFEKFSIFVNRKKMG